MASSREIRMRPSIGRLVLFACVQAVKALLSVGLLRTMKNYRPGDVNLGFQFMKNRITSPNNRPPAAHNGIIAGIAHSMSQLCSTRAIQRKITEKTSHIKLPHPSIPIRIQAISVAGGCAFPVAEAILRFSNSIQWDLMNLAGRYQTGNVTTSKKTDHRFHKHGIMAWQVGQT